MIRFIDLFAGIGGFHYGLCYTENRRDYSCVYANEWNKYANAVYRKHFETCDDRDIRTIDAADIPDHDLLCGGFPCQSFSVAGKRGGFADIRGTLFFEIARILQHKKPRLLLLENVKGLLNHEQGRTFQTIITTLDELGYDLQWQVLNSKDFGVPQNRERVYLIGNLRGTPRPQVFPFSGEVSQAATPGTDEQSGSQKFIKTRHLSQNGTLLSDAITLQASEIPHTIDLKRIKSQTARGIVKTGYSAALETGQPQGLITDTLIRRLTPLECERLQGFPDNWTQYGGHVTPEGFTLQKMSDNQRYKMCGNAVTTRVIEAIAARLV